MGQNISKNILHELLQYILGNYTVPGTFTIFICVKNDMTIISAAKNNDRQMDFSIRSDIPIQYDCYPTIFTRLQDALDREKEINDYSLCIVEDFMEKDENSYTKTYIIKIIN